MSTAELSTDWQRSPPALGLVLSDGHHFAPHQATDERAMWDCIRPALAVRRSADFVREVSRRLPLFAALHAKLLGDVREIHADRTSVSEGYAALEKAITHWGRGLDDITQTELDVAVTSLHRSNEALPHLTSESAETADLFRATVLVEFLLFCLWSLVRSGEHPPITGQVIYNLRYAALDYAAAVRQVTRGPAAPPDVSPSPTTDDGPEDAFWTLAGTLPLLDAEDAA